MGNCVDRFMFLLAILVAVSVGGAGIALSQTLSLDDQSAMAVGEKVTFTLSIDNPSSGAVINTLGVDIDFDPMVLDLNKGMDGSSEVGITYTRGTLGEASYAFFLLVSNPDSRTIRVGGLNPAGGVQPGQSGELVQLHFTVASMADTMLTITPKDDVASFMLRNGQLTFPTNDPPMVGPITVNSQGESVVIDVLGHMSVSDPDGDALMVSAVGLAANGTAVDNNDGTITYTPDSGFVGSDNFTYTVSDGTDAGTEMVTVNVTEPPNNAPMPHPDPDPAMTDAGESVMIRVSDYVSDPDGDTLTVSSVGPAAYGTVVDNEDGTFTYTPDDNYSGEDQFTFTVSDGDASVDVVVDIIVEAAEPVEPVEPVDPDPGDNGDSGGGGGGCTLNPGAPFDPTLVSVLALFMGVYFVRRFTRRQSLR